MVTTYCNLIPFKIYRQVNIEHRARPIKLSIDRVINAIEVKLGIQRWMLLCKSRKQQYGDARLIAYWLMLTYTSVNTVSIGKLFNRDHSSIYHGKGRFSDLYETDKVFRKKADEVRDFLLMEGVA